MTFDPGRPINPFEAPRAEIGEGAVYYDNEDIAEDEDTRRRYLSHEASVKALGSLQYLGAFFCLLLMFFFFAAAAGLVAGMTNQPGIAPEQMAIFNGVIGLVALFGFVFYGGLGYGLRNLQVWARWVIIVLTSLSLLINVIQVVIVGVANPQLVAGVLGASAIPSLITGYILYLVASAKGGVVFSRQYKDVIRRTPHIKYKTSIIVKIFLALLLFVIVLGLIGVLMSLRR